MFGLAGWHTSFGTRIGLTTCLYVMALCIRWTRFQPVLGLDYRPAIVFRRSPNAGIDA